MQHGNHYPLSAITNNFTVEFWVNPQTTHQIDAQSQTGTTGTSGQCYAVYPAYGGAAVTGRSSMDVSVGTNGVSVYEHAEAYMPPLLVWQGSMTVWKHVVVVYTNKTPSLYINGQLVKTGLTSNKSLVSPGYTIGGGSYGVMQGSIDELRIWNVARTQQQIAANYTKGVSPTEAGLAGYWPLSPQDKTTVTDISCNHNHLTLPATGYSWLTTGANLENIIGVESVNRLIVPKHGLPTNYAYNSLNQVIRQSSPDGGITNFWYDRLGKLVASQNAEQLESSDPGTARQQVQLHKV